MSNTRSIELSQSKYILSLLYTDHIMTTYHLCNNYNLHVLDYNLLLVNMCNNS